MYGTRSILSCLCIILIACTFFAGCANTTPANETAQPTVTQGSNTGPLYGAGDVVRNPKVSSGTAWLVISYDPASDTYERALIYPNSDGSWGYRADSRTEKADRSIMEKVYTEKVTTITPASVPVRTPTIPSTAVTASVTTAVASSSTTAVTTVATVQSAGKPSIKRIIPDKGDAGTSVAVTDLTGNNFVSGASVKLVRSGSTDIVATNVRVVGLTSIMCTIPIPSDAPAGTWDLVVTNPDGQSATYTNLFSVHRSTSIVTTTTVSTGTIPVTDIDPPFGIAHNEIKYTITGSKFQNGATIKLHNSDKSADIVGTNVIWVDANHLTCFFDIPGNSLGNWDIIVTNPDSTTGTKIGGFEIRN